MTDHRTLSEYQQEAVAAIERLRQRHGAHPEWWELLTRAREAVREAPADAPPATPHKTAWGTTVSNEANEAAEPVTAACDTCGRAYLSYGEGGPLCMTQCGGRIWPIPTEPNIPETEGVKDRRANAATQHRRFDRHVPEAAQEAPK
jgi:hypothetical protein